MNDSDIAIRLEATAFRLEPIVFRLCLPFRDHFKCTSLESNHMVARVVGASSVGNQPVVFSDSITYRSNMKHVGCNAVVRLHVVRQ